MFNDQLESDGVMSKEKEEGERMAYKCDVKAQGMMGMESLCPWCVFAVKCGRRKGTYNNSYHPKRTTIIILSW